MEFTMYEGILVYNKNFREFLSALLCWGSSVVPSVLASLPRAFVHFHASAICVLLELAASGEDRFSSPIS